MTLKSRPFSNPGDPEYAATERGWQPYAVNVTRIGSRRPRNHGHAQRRIDLEIWNELTFGSEFLSTEKCGEASSSRRPRPPSRAPTCFPGVLIGDGFANTIPWPASATELARIGAIDQRPLAPQRTCQGAQLGAARIA